jgi:hypothetical protein
MIAVLSLDEKKPEAKPVFARKQASRKSRVIDRQIEAGLHRRRYESYS